MKLTICGSITFLDEMKQLKKNLERMDHSAKIPAVTVKDKHGIPLPAKEFYTKFKKTAAPKDTWIWRRVQGNIHAHFKKIGWSDAILVANYDKNGIAHYIGGNTLMEMGLALCLKKKIYLLNPIPEVSYKEEILAMQPVVIHARLDAIKK